MKTLGILARVSSDTQVEKGKSLQTQKSYGIKKAKELGYKHLIYEERGVSASKGKYDRNRPVLQKLLQDCDSGKVDDIYVIDQDRLGRSMEEQITLKARLKNAGVKIYSNAGIIDFTDIDSAFLSDLKALLGELETTKLSKRIQRVLEESVSKGGVGTGKSVPFGYFNNEGKLAVDENTKGVVQRIFKMCIGGMGTKHIATVLTTEGILSPKGGKWRDASVYGILTNTCYYGKRYWKGNYYDSPSIITEDTFNKAKASLQKRGNTLKNEKKYIYTLNDLLVCGVCGKNMRGRRNTKDGSNIYKCTSNRNTGEACSNKSINRPMLEALVTELVTYEVNGNSLIADIIASDNATTPQEVIKEQMIEELTQYKNKKNELIDFYTKGILDSKEFEKATTAVSNKIINLESHLESMNFKPSELTGKNEITSYKRFGLKRKHQLLKQLFSNVTVTYIKDLKYWRLTFYSGTTNNKIIRVNINYKGVFNAFMYMGEMVDITPTISGTIQDNPFNRMSKNGLHNKKNLINSK